MADKWAEQFFSLPMGASSRDPVVGVDDIGRDIYRSPTGETYWFDDTVQKPRGSVVKALLDRSVIDTAKDLAGGVVNGVWDGISAPGRALMGEPMTYGDVFNTAGMAQLGAAAMPAPRGALRSGSITSTSPGEFYHVAPPEYSGGALKSLYSQMGNDAYDEFARRWPEAANMGEYHADNVFMFDDLADAMAHAESTGGNILRIDPEYLDVSYDMLEVPSGRKKGYPFVQREIPADSILGFLKGK